MPVQQVLAGYGAGSGLDPAAAAFLTATGITDATISSAINQLCLDLKGYGIFAKCYAIYPWVGGTATTCKYNLVNPVDSDGAYRLTFHGGFTYDANGITPDGVLGTYADTHLNGLSVLSKTDSHYSFYSRTDVDGLLTDYGPESALPRLGNVFYQDIPVSSDRANGANTDSRGFFNGNLSATDSISYKNGTQVAALGHAAASNYGNATQNFCAEDAGDRPSTRNLAFGSIGQNLTPTQAANFYTAVQAFQTALSRQV